MSMRKTKIVILTNTILPDRCALFTALCPLLEDVMICLSDALCNREQMLVAEHATVVEQQALRWNWSFKNPSGFQDKSEIRIPYGTLWELVRCRADVVISGELGFRTLFCVLYRILFPQTILILWATLSDRTESSRGMIRKILRRWILAKIDAAFVNGKSGERYLRGMGFQKAIFTVPYTVNEKEFTVGEQTNDEEVIHLFGACQLIERKGLHIFLPILAKWCEEHPARRIDLCVVGEGPELERLSSYAYPPNLDVRFVGRVRHEEMTMYYQQATLFIFPTLADEWGLVVAESLSCGVPVLGSIYSQAVEELVVDGYNGWTFTPTNEAETYDAINRALGARKDERHAMALNAHKSIEHIVPEVVAKSIADAVRTVQGGRE